MKKITLFLSLLFVCLSCNAQKKTNKIDESQLTFIYEANTRGFYEKATIANKSIKVSKDRDGNDKPSALAITAADWKLLLQYLAKTNLSQLSKLKDPSQKRFHDGAASAYLQINYKDKTYTTTNFDHGFPPAVIKKLVDKIVFLIEKE
jgi:hypothetical protein